MRHGLLRKVILSKKQGAFELSGTASCVVLAPGPRGILPLRTGYLTKLVQCSCKLGCTDGNVEVMASLQAGDVGWECRGGFYLWRKCAVLRRAGYTVK